MAASVNPSGMRRLRHRLEWLLLSGLVHWLQQGDLRQAYRRAHLLTPLLRRLLRSEWAWANSNLQWVYGTGLDPSKRRQLAAMAMENMVRSHLDGLRPDPYHLDGESEAQSEIQNSLQLGRGLIICGIHLGSWEIGLKWAATLGHPIHVIYRHANNPFSEQLFMAARAHYGIHWIRRDEPLKIVRALQKKEILVLMTDINQRRDGLVAPFLGIPALCPAGPARFALRWHVPLLPIVCLREAGIGQFRLLTAPLLIPQADEAEIPLTTRINQSFEPWIQEHAEQYNWLHARWRSRPDGTLWRADTPPEQLAQARSAPPLTPSARLLQLLNV
jgi:lauroyl/myristoyl acyltransferase